MSWQNVVKSSEGYWNASRSPFSFCVDCCSSDKPEVNIGVHHSANSSLYDRKKRITPYWTKEEDKKLIKYSEKYNCDWDLIAEKFPEKTASQLARRWSLNLNPNLKHEPWTADEDLILKNVVIEIGYNWENVGKYIQGRSADAIKQRFLNSVLPTLNQRELRVLQSKLGLVSEGNHSMDIDSLNFEEENKEAYLVILNKRLEEMEEALVGTRQNIERLEDELNDSQTLLS